MANISTINLNGSKFHTRPYGTCTTAAATAAKVVSMTEFSEYYTGCSILVKFTYANTAASPTLNVNGKGAKYIRYNNLTLPATQYWLAGSLVEFVYDGTYFQVVGTIKDNNTTSSSTDEKVKCTAATTTKSYVLGVTASGISSGTAYGANYDTGVYLDTTAGKLTATTFAGNLTGNVTGNCSGSSGSCTGNAATASSSSVWSNVGSEILNSDFNSLGNYHGYYNKNSNTGISNNKATAGHIVSFNSGSCPFQISTGYKSTEGIYYRKNNTSGTTGWSAWSELLTVDSSGNLTSAARDIATSGKFSATSGFFETSDERLKTFSGKISVDFEKLAKLKKNYFKWNYGENADVQIGVSAQEIREIYPEIVSEDPETGRLSVAYDKLSVVALAAIDELYVKNLELEERIARLENFIMNK